MWLKPKIGLLSAVECVDKATEVHFVGQEELSIERGEGSTPGRELLSQLDQLNIGGTADKRTKLICLLTQYSHVFAFMD